MRSHLVRRVLGVTVAASAVLGVMSAPAWASTTPPNPDPGLIGTWVNVDPATRSVPQIVVQSSQDTGGILVDAFGACVPSLCEWGLVPAIIYGPNVSAKTGANFQTDQYFTNGGSEWSRIQLQASLLTVGHGTKTLRVRELTEFEDGSGRHNYTVTETFVLGQSKQPATVFGNSTSGYPFGAPPAAAAGLAGDWKTTGNSVIELQIGVSGGVPDVHAFGSCSPTACDMGDVRAITYGTNISSTTGNDILAPYSFSFKNEQLYIRYVPGKTPATDKLLVGNYNEFTDGSGRSNYVVGETFTRA